jgi:hypothetical protein
LLLLIRELIIIVKTKYTIMENREAYKKKFEAQLDEWKAETEKLKAKARKAKANAEIDITREMEKLEKRRDDLKVRLRNLEGSSKEAWVEIKEGLDQAGKDMKAALEKAKRKFS